MSNKIKTRTPFLMMLLVILSLEYAFAQNKVVVVPLGGPSGLLNQILNQQESVADNASFSIFSPACPAGWRLTGGGFLSSGFGDNIFAGSRPVKFNSFSVINGVNAADSWLCQGRNESGSSSTVTCFAVCATLN